MLSEKPHLKQSNFPFLSIQVAENIIAVESTFQQFALYISLLVKFKSGLILHSAIVFLRPNQPSKKVFIDKRREQLIKGIFPKKNSLIKQNP